VGAQWHIAQRIFDKRGKSATVPVETHFCGTECRVANAVMAVRAASAVPADTEGVSELLDAVLDSLDEVLREVGIGSYIPSMIDAMAALEFAREKASSGCLASELAPLIQVGITLMVERLKGDGRVSGSVAGGWSTRINPRAH
jgi:hypothetical protein